jgi:acetylornithine deacetylase/succinyl-diaminopimelate desuccinylase-like protein
MGEQGRMFDALLHNTANVTRVRGGDKENVVPGEVTAFLDCRLVPGQEPANVIAGHIEAAAEAVDWGTDRVYDAVDRGESRQSKNPRVR